MPALARGCAILGTGGGGEVYTGSLILLEALRVFGPVEVVTLEDLDPEGLLLPLGGIGAPTVGVEKLPSGDEGIRLRDHLEQVTGRKAVARDVVRDRRLQRHRAARLGGRRWGSRSWTPTAWGGRSPRCSRSRSTSPVAPPELFALTDALGNVVDARARRRGRGPSASGAPSPWPSAASAVWPTT